MSTVPATGARLADLAEAALGGAALTPDQGLLLYRGLDLPSLGLLGNAIRQRLNRGDRVTYIIDRNLNPTNVCVTDCGFCAFYRSPDAADAYVLPREVIYRKVDETLAAGGRQLLLQGGHHPRLRADWFAQLFADLKRRYPGLWIHGMSPPEITHLARLERRPVRDILRQLRAAGLDSIPGGGAEILVDRVREEIAPKKATTAEWLEVMRQAAALGMRGTATMMFGHVESDEDRVAHLTRIRELQDECGVFTAFIPWTFQPENTELGRRLPHKATVAEYLRLLAFARIYLQNVQHLQASFVTQGNKTCQTALALGADDFGSVMLEENVVSAAGCSQPTTVAEIERHIKDAGYVPQRRTMLYEWIDTPPTDRFGRPPRSKTVVSEQAAPGQAAGARR
jgi:cyclic dehypoxanthinyl futalosine synthase